MRRAADSLCGTQRDSFDFGSGERRRTGIAKGKRLRAPNGVGTIDQRPSGRWRLRVRLEGRQVTYGLYDTEEAWQAQARWRLTHLLPKDDPDLKRQVPASVAVGGVRL